MLLKKNRKKSSTKKMKHIPVRYFFIKDRVPTDNVELKHCSTTKMLADQFTEPLKGDLLQRFRAELMKISEDTDMTEMGWDGTKEKCVLWKLHNEPDTACPHECVGNDKKGTSIPDASASEVLHKCITGKKIDENLSPILNRVMLGNPGKKIFRRHIERMMGREFIAS